MILSEERISQLVKNVDTSKSYNDIFGKDRVIEEHIKSSIESIFEEELSEHFSYKKYSSVRYNVGNTGNLIKLFLLGEIR